MIYVRAKGFYSTLKTIRNVFVRWKQWQPLNIYEAQEFKGHSYSRWNINIFTDIQKTSITQNACP